MLSLTFHAGLDLLRRRWLIAALCIFFVAVFAQYNLKLHHSEHGIRSAFLRWQPQLEDLDAGVNVWDKYAYPNPPIMAILLKPFLALSPALGAALWFACKAFMALAAILGVWSLLDAPERPFPLWGKALAVLMTLRPIEGDLVHGNVNLLILFLIVASLYAYCERRDALAGALLGLSIACKLTPALFILYFLWKRSWAALLGIAASLVVFVLVIPGIVYGWSNNLDYLQSWQRQMIAPYAAGVVTSEHKNQSLPGLLHRMLSDEASFSDYDGDRKIVLDTHNVVSWNRNVVQAIVIGCIAIYVLLAIGFCRTSTDLRPRLLMMAEFSVVILGMLLFCERTWKHHCVTLLLPFSVIAYGLSVDIFSRSLHWYLGITMALISVLMLSTSTGVFDSHVEAAERIGKLSQVYGAYVWAFLLLLASMFVIFRSARVPLKDPSCPSIPGPS